jgi:DNA processing protein
MENRADERAALVALLRAPGRSWPEITADVIEAGSARSVWERQSAAALVTEETSPLEAAASEIARWAARGWTVTTVLDGEYPARLREIHQAPPILFSRGALIRDDPAVSVVGSRQASERGLAMAADVASELVSLGVTVVAGLARGIDTAAHRATLDAGGRTVAVIATGISRVYPSENHGLHEEIAARGLLLSQFWPEAAPQRYTFLMRNATMSGYGLVTVVVEAGEKSGSRVQARLAVEHGRPVVLTDRVVASNDWARALAGRAGVYVVSGVRDLGAVIARLLSERAEVDAELRRLASA